MSVRLLTAEELAERWRVKTSQIYRLTREGKIPVVEVGRYYRYRVEAIEAYELGGTDSVVPASLGDLTTTPGRG